MTPTLFTERPHTRAGIVPRPYQEETHDQFFKLYEEGVRSALIRLFTGGGKTLLACLIADTWLRRGDLHRVMVVSYEKQLVWQFAQEVEDYLGIKPGIEMEAEAVSASRVPKIVVASRATLLRKPPATKEQAEALASFGVPAIGSCTKKLADTYLRHLRKGGDLGSVLDDLQARNAKPDVDGDTVSRLHKFDWRFNWLVIWDEAHKHAKKLPSVGHIADWFERNANSCRLGLTATPKRTDQTAIQHTMFQGTACDYPLYHISKPSAVKDGYAVPYVQKYIEVEGVDFRQIKRLTSGGDFDEAALEAALGEEAVLAKLVGPLLELVGDRRTLIFSPGVEMAKNVARFINARRPAKCECGMAAWYPAALIGDGAACECGRFITNAGILSHDDQARQLDGQSPTHERKGIYKGHQGGHFQFLSICGLCREGYNDPDVSCIAVFRPVSKKASSLAEQMKGRGCRLLRALAKTLHNLPDAEARVQAIADSAKPDCLIVDLVGITGLADCASTVEIYADGLADEVKKRAEEILSENADKDEPGDVEAAIEQAGREAEETAAKVKAEREAAERRAREEYERRAKADAKANYTTHEVGYGSNVDPNAITEGQLNFIALLGMHLEPASVTKRQAGRIIGQLKARIPVAEVARLNAVNEERWRVEEISLKIRGLMRWKGVSIGKAKTGYDCFQILDATKEPQKFESKKLSEIRSARDKQDLDAVAQDLCMVRTVLPEDSWKRLADAGRKKRESCR